MLRVVLAGGVLMVFSAFTREYVAQGDSLPCGAQILPKAGEHSAQERDVMYVVGEYDPARNPAVDLDSAIARARAEEKRILIQVGGE